MLAQLFCYVFRINQYRIAQQQKDVTTGNFMTSLKVIVVHYLAKV